MSELKDDDWICLHCRRVGSAAQWKEWGAHVDEDYNCSICDSLCYQAGDLGITFAKAGLTLVTEAAKRVLDVLTEGKQCWVQSMHDSVEGPEEWADWFRRVLAEELTRRKE